MKNREIPDRLLRLLSEARRYSREAQFDRAADLHELITEQARELFGEKDLFYAQSLGNWGLVLLEAGEFDRSEALLRKALELTMQAPNATSEDRAIATNNLGGYYQETGRDDESLPLFKQALELEKAASGENSSGYAQVLNNFALALQNVGRYEEAAPPAEQALAVRRRVLPAFHPEIGESLNNLGLLYERIGRFAEADPLYREAISIYRAHFGPLHPRIATSLSNLGLLQQKMARAEDAETLFRDALSIAIKSLGKFHPTTLTIVGNLGMLYHDLGRYAEAKTMFQAEVKIASALDETSSEHLGVALNHLGLIQLRVEEFSQARQSLGRALEVLGPATPENELLVSSVLNNKSLVDLETGHYADAEASLRKVSAIRKRRLGESHPDYELAIFNLATCLIPQGRLREATELLQQASAIDDVLLEQVFSISSEGERLALTGMVRQRFELFLAVLSESFAEDQSARAAALDLVLRRKCIVLDAAAAQKLTIHADRYPELKDKCAELNDLAAKISRMTMDGPDSVAPAVHAEQLADLRRRAARLEAYLSSRMPEMRATMLRRTGSRHTIARSLPLHSAVVEFVRIFPIDLKPGPQSNPGLWTRPRYLCFVLCDGLPEEAHAIDLGDADVIDAAVARARTALIEEGLAMGLPSQPALRSARQAIFDPIENCLQGRKRVFISPDGELSTLPFEALVTDAGQPLIHEYSFSYLTTARDIQRTEEAPAGRAEPPIVIADPDYDLSSAAEITQTEEPEERQRRARFAGQALRFAPLPGTRAEGEHVAALLKTTARCGGRALEKFVKNVRAPRVIHLATHGFFLAREPGDSTDGATPGGESHELRPRHFRSLRDLARIENPLLRSGLALAGANTWLAGGSLSEEAEDGLLTAEDVSGLNLFGTELVVLSACETALGEAHTGEGVFGLRRAFTLAGARTTIMSLWQVPDKETVALMRIFYERLLAGLSPSHALREAQQAIRTRLPSPFFWAAFICQGEDRPLSDGSDKDSRPSISTRTEPKNA